MNDRGVFDLIRAASEGNADYLRAVLTPFEVDKLYFLTFNETVLTASVRSGSLECVKICLENSANIEHVDVAGNTALTGAALYGHLAMARLLLEAGAQIIDSHKLLTTLVCEDNRTDIAALLIDYGASGSAVSPWAEAVWMRREQCRLVAITVIGAHRHCRAAAMANQDPNIIRLVAKYIWSTRMNE